MRGGSFFHEEQKGLISLLQRGWENYIYKGETRGLRSLMLSILVLSIMRTVVADNAMLEMEVFDYVVKEGFRPLTEGFSPLVKHWFIVEPQSLRTEFHDIISTVTINRSYFTNIYIYTYLFTFIIYFISLVIIRILKIYLILK